MSNLRKRAEFRFALPSQLSRTTIERWYYQAKGAENPVEALFPKSRVGESTVLSAEMLIELERSYREFPQWTTQLHYC